MNFAVQLTQETGEQPAQVIRTIRFEETDLHSLVARLRIILETRGYEPNVDAFRILDKGRLLYRERRDHVDAAA